MLTLFLKIRKYLIAQNHAVLSVLIVSSCLSMNAQNVFVSKQGNDSFCGSQDAPYKTIARAVEDLKPGDTCFIMQGIYHEEVGIKEIKATRKNPVVITSYPGHKVILDGSVGINGPWEHYRGNIYKTRIKEDIWQLFYNNQWMLMARWPNASLKDGSIWDQNASWVHGDATVENGTFSVFPSEGKDLASSGIDMGGAMAILNVGSFRTYSRRITRHMPGSNMFNYEPVPRSGYRTKHHYAYIEGKLGLLDQENEWFYDKEEKILYAIFPGGGEPRYPVKGKIQTYAFKVSNCRHLKIQGLDFFGTTVSFKACTFPTLEDCNFMYPAYSGRMLGVSDLIRSTAFYSGSESVASHATIRNCCFENTDGHALVVEGDHNILENCLFKNIDISCSEIPGIGVSIQFTGKHNIIRRNTITNCSASETLSPGIESLIELNRISITGMLQSDGAMIHCMKPEQPDVEIRYNWCHDSKKYGIRFDGKPASENGFVHHNVVWNVEGGYQLKGNSHRAFNNTGFGGIEKNDFIFLSDEAYGGNKDSEIRNNIAGKMSGDRSLSTELFPVPGHYDHNWNGYESDKNLSEELRDFRNLDYRPADGSLFIDAGVKIAEISNSYLGPAPDLGAYEYGDTIYWIPGRKTNCASTPVPPNGTTTAKANCHLMWLEAYKSLSHHIFFGTDMKAVSEATISSPEFKGNQTGNIFDPGKLDAGKSYYWRIDAIKGNKIVKGDVWKFTVINSEHRARMD